MPASTSLNLPSSTRIDYGGLYVQQKQSFSDLATVFVAALLLSALLLTILFYSWAYTSAIIITVLLADCAVLAGLWIPHTELEIYTLMDITMVVGMLTELSIFYLAELPVNAALTGDGLIKAGRARLHPILMLALKPS